MIRPIPTPDQIEAFDHAELFAASVDFNPSDPGPEPGPNHSDAYWWGWWCRKNPRPDDPDPRAVEVYWAMRAFVREKRPWMIGRPPNRPGVTAGILPGRNITNADPP